MVVVVDRNEVAQLQMACNTCRFAGDTLHSTSIPEEAVCIVGEDVIPRFVKLASSMRLSNSKSYSIGEALAQWPCGNFDTWSIMIFRMSGSDAVNML